MFYVFVVKNKGGGEGRRVQICPRTDVFKLQLLFYLRSVNNKYIFAHLINYYRSHESSLKSSPVEGKYTGERFNSTSTGLIIF